MKVRLHQAIAYIIGFALCFLIMSQAYAQTPTQAIHTKDGAKCAAMFDDAIATNIRPECVRELAPIVAAIRYAENGKTYQYGVIHPRCPKGYRPQAGWCAATVQKNWDRWHKAGAKGEFITFLGGRYCPLDDPRDKDKLNRHWIPNVRKFKKRFAYPTK